MFNSFMSLRARTRRASVAITVTAAATALLVSVDAAVAQPAQPAPPPAFAVRVVGRGRPAILIPGLTNGGAVWDSTVNVLKNDHELHVLTLAGFAGQAPVTVDSTWLRRMRDEVVMYATANKLVKPVIIGHSLGGFLALWIGASTPSLPGAIINIDGLPFLGATQNPAATVASTRPQADAMRKMMSGGNAAGFAAMQAVQLKAMVRDSAWIPLLARMGATSDMRTTAEAMHALYTTDIRDSLGTVTAPVLNLHAWVAYKQYGVSRASTEAMLASQYRNLRTGTTALTDTGYHFVMLDEPAWTQEQMRRFLGTTK